MRYTKILWEMRKKGSCKSENRKIVGIMKKTAVILLLASFGGEDLLISCPKSAVAGETVTVETKDVTDGWVEVTASGAEVKAVQGDLFQFVMPKQNVDVRVLFVGDKLS